MHIGVDTLGTVWGIDFKRAVGSAKTSPSRHLAVHGCPLQGLYSRQQQVVVGPRQHSLCVALFTSSHKIHLRSQERYKWILCILQIERRSCTESSTARTATSISTAFSAASWHWSGGLFGHPGCWNWHWYGSKSNTLQHFFEFSVLTKSSGSFYPNFYQFLYPLLYPQFSGHPPLLVATCSHLHRSRGDFALIPQGSQHESQGFHSDTAMFGKCKKWWEHIQFWEGSQFLRHPHNGETWSNSVLKLFHLILDQTWSA